MKKYRYLFGPVPSRRFGRSLGIDLTPLKTCSFDCVFCQLGRTQHKTITRKEYVPIDEVLAELDDWLETDGNADYITLAGSGEPTLHTEFGRVLEHLKENTIPSVLLTNGSLLYIKEVREAAAFADIVKVSLSAWNQNSFEWVNRSHPELRFDTIADGQKKFKAQFNGEFWAEVFLLSGINSQPENVKKIAAVIKEINPDRIQLNTVARPPAEDFAASLPESKLTSLAFLFDPCAEVIADFNKSKAFSPSVRDREETILSMLQRRPCTIDQIAFTFGMHINEVSKILGSLMHKDHIHMVYRGNTVYYRSVLKVDKG
ncbi:MAG: radical SAM protein [Desulfobacterales bacterium]